MWRLLGVLVFLSSGAKVNFAGDIQASCKARKILPRRLVREIRSYAPVVQSIINVVLHGPEKNKTYEELGLFVDTFPLRLAGSKNLERSIDYMLDILRQQHFDKVYTEPVKVPHWIRGNERAWMIAPKIKRLPILGLGGSVGTGHRGITAPVFVVSSFSELQKYQQKVRGKIVVFNQEYVSYDETVKYRLHGPSAAAKAGAVAALVRSVTPLSIASLHGGQTVFAMGVAKIPAASITVEDAQLLKRLQERGTCQSVQYAYCENAGIKSVVKLVMCAKFLASALSRNTIAGIEGSLKPNEVVIVGGHIDSWDVGQGAMDDAGGAFVSWRSLALLRHLGLRPRRTLRCVLWTSEEMGFRGGQRYFEVHGKEAIERINVGMESDTGTFKPKGLGFTGRSEKAKCVVAEVLRLFHGINATQLTLGADTPDLREWKSTGVPVVSLNTHNERYFYFHHTDGDTMTVEDPKNLDLCTALWAGVAYVLADLKHSLPRT